MKRGVIISAVLVIFAFTVGYFMGDASAIKRVNEQVDAKIESQQSNYGAQEVETTGTSVGAQAEWKEVITFEGNSIKDTETFKVSSNEWRINWSTSPGDMGEMNFQIYAHKASGDLAGVAANIVGEGSDTSYMRGSGEYYLTINTAQPYTIVIEEKN